MGWKMKELTMRDALVIMPYSMSTQNDRDRNEKAVKESNNHCDSDGPSPMW